MRLPDLEAWAIFAAVAEHRSFSAAAEAIGLSKATVSKAVSRLEAQLGQSLFHRTSRRLALTEAGKPLADRAARMLTEARCAEETAHDGARALAGRIRLAAPMTFGVARIAPLLTEFLTRHPEIELELHCSDARVDIVAEGFDLALRIGDLPDSSLRARQLCGIATYLVAAPAYLRRHGTPTHPGQLGDHQLLGYTNVSGPWRFHHPDGAELSVKASGPLSANSGEALMPALVAGLGIARLPGFVLGDAIESGAAVELLPEWRPGLIGLHLLTPPSTLRPARVAALIAFLEQRLRD